MAEKPIICVVGFLTTVGRLLSLPIVGLYFSLHRWTSALIVDPRFIALVDKALESPVGQIAMIPTLAWIVQSPPPRLKATYFPVVASFSNLVFSLSNPNTKYLNQLYVVNGGDT